MRLITSLSFGLLIFGTIHPVSVAYADRELAVPILMPGQGKNSIDVYITNSSPDVDLSIDVRFIGGGGGDTDLGFSSTSSRVHCETPSGDGDLPPAGKKRGRKHASGPKRMHSNEPNFFSKCSLVSSPSGANDPNAPVAPAETLTKILRNTTLRIEGVNVALVGKDSDSEFLSYGGGFINIFVQGDENDDCCAHWASMPWSAHAMKN